MSVDGNGSKTHAPRKSTSTEEHKKKIYDRIHGDKDDSSVLSPKQEYKQGRL